MMQANNRKALPPVRGFTLIELLLALAVLSTVAAIALPSFFSSYLQHRALDQGIASVMETMLTAKQLAIQSSKPYIYEYMPGSNLQLVYPLDQSREKLTTKLPSTIRLEPMAADTSNCTRMIYREDGTTEGITVVVVGAKQSQPIQVQRRLGIPQRVVMK